MGIADAFSNFAKGTAQVAGKPVAFGLAAAVVILWAITGPVFHYSDTWQLAINTGTTIVTFLMVFLIQHTQNRDAIAMQLKLDELLRAVRGAHTTLVDLEDATEDELKEVKAEFAELAAKARGIAKSAGAELETEEKPSGRSGRRKPAKE